MRFLLVVAAIGLLILSSTCASAASLDVLVTGLKNQAGYVHIALFDKPDHFPYRKGILLDEIVSIKDLKALHRFKNLPPGDYGIAVFHDENNNDEFDQGLFGIPLEDYGFSNNAPVFFGPPSFEAAKFTVTAPLTTAEIDLRK